MDLNVPLQRPPPCGVSGEHAGKLLRGIVFDRPRCVRMEGLCCNGSGCWESRKDWRQMLSWIALQGMSQGSIIVDHRQEWMQMYIASVARLNCSDYLLAVVPRRATIRREVARGRELPIHTMSDQRMLSGNFRVWLMPWKRKGVASMHARRGRCKICSRVGLPPHIQQDPLAPIRQSGPYIHERHTSPPMS